MRILRLTGLDRVLPPHATLADALGGNGGSGDDQAGQHDEQSKPERA